MGPAHKFLASIGRLKRSRGASAMTQVGRLLSAIFMGRARVYQCHQDYQADPEGADLFLRLDGDGIQTPMIQVRSSASFPKWLLNAPSGDGYAFLKDNMTGEMYFVWRIPRNIE